MRYQNLTLSLYNNDKDSRDLGTKRDKEKQWEGMIYPVFRGGGYQTCIKMLRSQKVHTQMCVVNG
jgi:hypothetical protein